MENQPLLKGHRDSGTDLRARDPFVDDNPAIRPSAGGGSQAQAYSHAAVFAVFFFPALGGLLFG